MLSNFEEEEGEAATEVEVGGARAGEVVRPVGSTKVRYRRSRSQYYKIERNSACPEFVRVSVSVRIKRQGGGVPGTVSSSPALPTTDSIPNSCSSIDAVEGEVLLRRTRLSARDR